MRLQRLRCALRHLASHPRAGLSLFAAVLLILCLVLLHSALRKGGLWDPSRHNDFKAYHTAAAAALDGSLDAAYADPDRPYQYPPTLATIIVPLGVLPYRAALVIWALAMLAVLLLTFRELDRVLCPPVKGVDKFLGFLLVYRMLQSDFANTNANVLVLGLVVWGFALERRSRSASAGIVLGLAAAVKVAPLLLVPWMLYRKRWPMFGGFAAGLLLWGVLVPATVLGPAEYSSALDTWYTGLLAPMNAAAAEYAQEAPGGYLPGQSLRALCHRLLRPIDASAHDDALVAVNIAELSKASVDALWAGLSLALLGGLLVLFWRRSRGRAASRGADPWGGAEIGVALLLTVVLSPLARKAHFVALLPAATYGFMLVRVAAGRRRRVLATLWGAAAALIVVTSPDVLGDHASAVALAFCPLTLAALCLAAMPIVGAPSVGAAPATRSPS